MFGYLRKPLWELVFQDTSRDVSFVLRSISIGKLLGYISIPLEEGMRPAEPWLVWLQFSKGKSIDISADWPDSERPAEQILNASISISPKLRRTQLEPDFLEIRSRNERRLLLEDSIRGVPLSSMTIEERIASTAAGRTLDEEPNFFGVCKQVFQSEQLT